MTRRWLACRVLLKIVYLLTCRVLGLAVLVFRGDRAKAAELLVLRHENAVLRRHAGRIRYEPGDRVWFAALARLLPRRRWTDIFPVTPATLLAWHRKLAGNKYDTSKRRKPGLWGARTCAEHLTCASNLGTRALSPRLSAHGSVVQLAGAPRAERHLKGCENLGVAARACGPAPSGPPPEAGLGRPGRDRPRWRGKDTEPEPERERGGAGARACRPADVEASRGAADVALFGHRHERPEQPQIHIDIHSATLSIESESVLDGPPAGGPDFGNAPASPSREPAGRGTTRMGQAIRLRRRPPRMTGRYQAGCAAALPRKAACRTRHGWRLRP